AQETNGYDVGVDQQTGLSHRGGNNVAGIQAIGHFGDELVQALELAVAAFYDSAGPGEVVAFEQGLGGRLPKTAGDEIGSCEDCCNGGDRGGAQTPAGEVSAAVE